MTFADGGARRGAERMIGGLAERQQEARPATTTKASCATASAATAGRLKRLPQHGRLRRSSLPTGARARCGTSMPSAAAAPSRMSISGVSAANSSIIRRSKASWRRQCGAARKMMLDQRQIFAIELPGHDTTEAALRRRGAARLG